MNGRHPSRRELLARVLAAAALGALPARAARAFGERSALDVCELVLPPGSVSRSGAWTRLLYEVDQTTSVETRGRTVQLAPDDPALFDHPFAVLVGNGPLDPLPESSVEQLSRFLQYGGFLFVDDASGVADSAFDASVRELCARLFPTRPLSPLPRDHSLYRAFFLIERPVGRLDQVAWLEGVSVGEVTPLVYGRNDLSGALERGADGRDALPVLPGGELQRREAVKLGVNLAMYALTSNYKKDITHVRELTAEGRLP